MDQQAANEAFNEFLNEEKLNADQIRFVRLIVDYISVNGMIEDRRVMRMSHFEVSEVLDRFLKMIWTSQ